MWGGRTIGDGEPLVARVRSNESVNVELSDISNVDVGSTRGGSVLVLLGAREVGVERSDGGVDSRLGALMDDGSEDEAGGSLSVVIRRARDGDTHGGLIVAMSKGATPSLVFSLSQFQAAFSASYRSQTTSVLRAQYHSRTY